MIATAIEEPFLEEGVDLFFSEVRMAAAEVLVLERERGFEEFDGLFEAAGPGRDNAALSALKTTGKRCRPRFPL